MIKARCLRTSNDKKNCSTWPLTEGLVFFAYRNSHMRALKEFESFKTKGKDFLRSSKSICFSFQSSFLSEIFNRTLFCLRICGFRVSKISVAAISSDD